MHSLINLIGVRSRYSSIAWGSIHPPQLLLHPIRLLRVPILLFLMLWWVINSFKRDCSTLYRDNNGRTFTSPDGPAKWPQADGKTPMILQNKWRIYWIQNLLKIRSKIRIRKRSFKIRTDFGLGLDRPPLSRTEKGTFEFRRRNIFIFSWSENGKFFWRET